MNPKQTKMSSNRGSQTQRMLRFLAVALALALTASACGSDSASDGATEASDEASTEASAASEAEVEDDDVSEAADTETEEVSEDVYAAFDANGDGSITIGVAAAGPADDGAYYQAVVNAAIEISAENGFNDPIVVDQIGAADAATALGDLASQVDIVIVGASEIAEPLGDLTEQYSDVFWYCNCGAGFPETPGLAQSLDDASEIAYTSGVATGLLLQDGDGTDVSFLGCCDLGFEKEFFLAFEMGLQSVSADYTIAYVPTGDFPYDFDNVANATEALNNAIAGGAAAVVPYLGGAHRPVVEAAAEAGLITMSAGASNVCDASEELDYSIAVRFDGGDYVSAVFPLILSGEIQEGQTKLFKVGVDPEPGAVICDATAEQQAAMDAVYAEIAADTFAGEFGAIKGEAYAGN